MGHNQNDVQTWTSLDKNNDAKDVKGGDDDENFRGGDDDDNSFNYRI